jgi:hypothetical protein
MKCILLLDVVVGESSAILKLLSCEDESLLIWGNSFLVLDLSLDGLNNVRAFNIKSDGLSSLDEDLHTTKEAEDEIKSKLRLDVVISKSAAILKILTRKILDIKMED